MGEQRLGDIFHPHFLVSFSPGCLKRMPCCNVHWISASGPAAADCTTLIPLDWGQHQAATAHSKGVAIFGMSSSGIIFWPICMQVELKTYQPYSCRIFFWIFFSSCAWPIIKGLIVGKERLGDIFHPHFLVSFSSGCQKRMPYCIVNGISASCPAAADCTAFIPLWLRPAQGSYCP